MSAPDPKAATISSTSTSSTSMSSTFYIRRGKRLLDLLVSSVGLIVLSPLLLLVAAAARLSSPGPALFRQVRIGQFEKPFLIWKFRTMRQSNSGPLLTAAGDSRITPLGRWLRKTKIDEFPQLFNVFRGEMSLVGPRPEVPLYTARYSAGQKEVFQAKPGITGPSIIMDEEELMAGQPDKEAFYLSTIMPAKLEIDLAYCQNVRFGEDLRMIFATLGRMAPRFGNIFGFSPANSDPHISKLRENPPRHTST